MNILGATSGLNASLGGSSPLASNSNSKPDQKNAFSESLGQSAGQSPAPKTDKKPAQNQELSASSVRSPLPSKPGPQGTQVKSEEPQAPVQNKAQFYGPETSQAGPSESELEKSMTLHHFMKRMQDELGIKVEDVLVAFASLTVSDLAKPPIQNVDKLTDALPITQAQEPLAKNIFLEMINNSEASHVSEQMGPAGQQLSLQLLSKQDAQKAALRSSLDQMQKDFFLDPKSMKPLSGEASLQSQTNSSELGLLNPKNQKLSILEQSPTNQFFKNEDILSQGTGLDNPMAQSVEEIPQEYLSVQDLGLEAQTESEDDSASIFPSKILGAATAGALATAATAKASKPASSSKLDGQIETSIPSESPELQGESDPFKALAESLKKQGESADSNLQKQNQAQSPELSMDAEIEPFSAEVATETTYAASPALVGKNEAAATLATPMFAQGLASPADQEANVKEVAEKTQLLIEKGGGQMKVTLRPDGMGELTMKVAVKNGQVAVEMVTETNEAKRFLEKGLSDLRSSLMSHKLEVEHIKVDTASDISKQMDQKQDESSRQAAHQFMEQFRQDNQAWRRNFFDLPGARGYKSQTKDEADNAILAAQSNRGSGDRKRLDLVA